LVVLEAWRTEHAYIRKLDAQICSDSIFTEFLDQEITMTRIRPFALLAACLFVGLAGLAASASAAGPHGYSVVDGELLYFDLSDGSFEVIGPTGVDGYPMEALTDGPAGFIYGIKPDASLDSELYRFDLRNGQGELIGSLETPNGAQDPLNTLAYLPDGFLYAFNPQGNLYRIDPATAEVSLVLELGLTAVDALAAIESQLYVFYEQHATLNCRYGRVDVQTLTFQPLSIQTEACTDMAAVTPEGKLILAGIYTSHFGPDWDVEVIEFDPTNPTRSRYIGGWTGMFWDPSTKFPYGLARIQGVPVVDVPATNLLGRVLFVVGLALAALFLIQTANAGRN
jgi:hypothetical protein